MALLKNKSFIGHTYFWIISAILFTKCVKAKIGYFWHISDLHLDTFYSTKGDVIKSCWAIDLRQTSASGLRPGRFGDYHCDSPWSLLESATNAMKSRQGDNVEFVLWTGDGLSDSSRRMLESHRFEILRNITDLLGRTFSSQFVFPVLGHNDGPDISFRRLGELWRQWLPSEALQTFEKGGYYTIEQTKSRLRIIALNTNFMQHDPIYSNQVAAAVRKRHPNPLNHNMNGGGNIGDSNEYKNLYYHHGGNHQHRYHGDSSINGYGGGSSSNHHHYMMGGEVSALSGGFDNQETQKQWDWLEAVLAKSKDNKETVYIVGHMPPGSDERIVGASLQHGHSTYSEKNNLRYLKLIRKYSSIIQGQFFGHLHSDSFRIIYDDKGKPASWIMISPSVTPRKISVGSNNPAMRLYKFDTDSGQVLDYTQYYLDLKSANTIGEANWIPEYNLTHYYGLVDISAASLHNFADRFSTGDNFGFSKYHRANTVRLEGQQCDSICMLNHYCAITRLDYLEYRLCLEKEKNLLRSSSSSFKTLSLPLILLCSTTSFLSLTTIILSATKKLIFPKLFGLNLANFIIFILLNTNNNNNCNNNNNNSRKINNKCKKIDNSIRNNNNNKDSNNYNDENIIKKLIINNLILNIKNYQIYFFSLINFYIKKIIYFYINLYEIILVNNLLLNNYYYGIINIIIVKNLNIIICQNNQFIVKLVSYLEFKLYLLFKKFSELLLNINLFYIIIIILSFEIILSKLFSNIILLT